MCSTSVNFLSTADVDDSLCGIAECTCCVDHIVNEDNSLISYITDDVHNLAYVCSLSALVNDSERNAETVCEVSCSCYRTEVGGNYHNIVLIVLELFNEVWCKDRHTEEVVNRDIEEALYLRAVEVHGKNSVCACCCDKVGNELCGDRISCLSLSVLTGIAHVRDNRCDTACGSSLECIDHNEKLHEVVVYRAAQRLNNENVRASDTFLNGNADLAVRECNDL